MTSYPTDPYGADGYNDGYNQPPSGYSAGDYDSQQGQRWSTYERPAEPVGYPPEPALYQPSQAYQQSVPYPVHVNVYAPPGISLAAPYGIEPTTGLPYSSKSKTAAGLLGIFLGGFGVGRFYTGHVGLGIAQVLVTFFTLGFGAWWGLIDGIVMLAGRPTDATGLPLR